MDHKPRKIVNDLRLIRLISHITKKTLSYLHSTKIEQMTKTMVIFKRGAIFLFCIRCDTTTNFRPAASAYSQRYHLLFTQTGSDNSKKNVGTYNVQDIVRNGRTPVSTSSKNLPESSFTRTILSH